MIWGLFRGYGGKGYCWGWTRILVVELLSPNSILEISLRFCGWSVIRLQLHWWTARSSFSRLLATFWWRLRYHWAAFLCKPCQSHPGLETCFGWSCLLLWVSPLRWVSLFVCYFHSCWAFLVKENRRFAWNASLFLVGFSFSWKLGVACNRVDTGITIQNQKIRLKEANEKTKSLFKALMLKI